MGVEMPMNGSAVVELRQYTLWPGQRDVLIELFDRELVETQEATGMRLIGQFRDLDRPDRFVWLRGFPDMEQRRTALEAFYGGPVWAAHGEAASATMVDCDDVLLLRPLTSTSAFDALPPRPAADADVPAESSTVAVTVCSLDQPLDVTLAERTLLPKLAALASPPIATLVEDPSENTFPRLPIRTGEHVVVWLQHLAVDHPEHPALQQSQDLAQDLLPDLVAVSQLRLQPTPRSRLR